MQRLLINVNSKNNSFNLFSFDIFELKKVLLYCLAKLSKKISEVNQYITTFFIFHILKIDIALL